MGSRCRQKLKREFKKLQRGRHFQIVLRYRFSFSWIIYIGHFVTNKRSVVSLAWNERSSRRGRGWNLFWYRSRCCPNLKFDNFTSSFGRLHQKIAPKGVPHDYFSSLNQSNHWLIACGTKKCTARAAWLFFLIQPIMLLICDVVVVIAVVVFWGLAKLGNIVAETMFLVMFPGVAKLGNICFGRKICVRQAKNVFDSRQKHFWFPSSKICFRNTCLPPG